MNLRLQPVQVATGYDEEGMLVFDENQRLLAVLTCLSDQHHDAAGQWFLEVLFGRVGSSHPSFTDLDAAPSWISEHLVQQA